MNGSFNFKGEDSFEDYGLVCKSIKRPLLPALKSNRVEMVGASGAHDFEDYEYSLRSITVRIAYIGEDYEDLRSRARQIAKWLSTKGWEELVFFDEKDKYYLAKVTNDIDLNTLFESGTADITFDCQPFAYSVEESTFAFELIYEELGSVPVACIFGNDGTREINFKSPIGSVFMIGVEGSWTNLTFSLNGKTLTFNEAGTTASLVIDNWDMTVTKDGNNKFDQLSGDIDDFLTIIPGENILEVGGIWTEIVVGIMFKPLWI